MKAPERLKAWRGEVGLSQGEAAQRAHKHGAEAVSQSSWSRIEAGTATPDAVLAVAIEEMTRGSDHPVPVALWRTGRPVRRQPRTAA